MKEKESFDDFPPRLDVQSIRQSIKRAVRLLSRRVDVERLDADLADPKLGICICCNQKREESGSHGLLR